MTSSAAGPASASPREVTTRLAEIRDRLTLLSAGTPSTATDVEQAEAAAQAAQQRLSQAYRRASQAHKKAAAAHQSAGRLAELNGDSERARRHYAAVRTHDAGAIADAQAGMDADSKPYVQNRSKPARG